ncbi:hypothetical protein DPMN_004797 [Dreissena polymorpha]|uniref:Uncharacterized protein n=1 Tax=Dreissena polymorpha TaxID=45954 RepID=A0A9D4RVX3_DREPO|nr:hypothetical protein DPMN_004797 [Dreissena polymorpha]
MDEIETMIPKDKPKVIYIKLKDKYDDLECPSGTHQIRDKKKYLLSKDRPHAS